MPSEKVKLYLISSYWFHFLHTLRKDLLQFWITLDMNQCSKRHILIVSEQCFIWNNSKSEIDGSILSVINSTVDKTNFISINFLW